MFVGRCDECVHPPIRALGQQVDKRLKETHTKVLQVLRRFHLSRIWEENVPLEYNYRTWTTSQLRVNPSVAGLTPCQGNKPRLWQWECGSLPLDHQEAMPKSKVQYLWINSKALGVLLVQNLTLIKLLFEPSFLLIENRQGISW